MIDERRGIAPVPTSRARPDLPLHLGIGGNAAAPAAGGDVAAVEELHRYGRERSVAVLPENVPGPFVSVETFPTLFDRTDASMTLDTGHARVSGFEDDDIVDYVANHGDRIAHVHLNDTRGPRDEHLPVGMGTVDFAAILGALSDDWAGTLTVEALTADFEYVETGVRRVRSLLE